MSRRPVDSDLTSIDKLEAYANGELEGDEFAESKDLAGYDELSTEDFFFVREAGLTIVTPNGFHIKVSEVKTFEYCPSDMDMWILCEGEVVKAPGNREFVDNTVTFLLKRDGSVCYSD